MSEIAAMIIGSEKLTSIFGRWPSFHDAEVHELHFWRGYVDAEAKVYNFPVLTVKIHLWLMTNEVNERGYYVLTNHTLASIRFLDVNDFKMDDFNQQNVISGLIIEQKIREQGATPHFSVEFHASFGMDASFTCLRIEVIQADPCTSKGVPLG